MVKPNMHPTGATGADADDMKRRQFATADETLPTTVRKIQHIGIVSAFTSSGSGFSFREATDPERFADGFSRLGYRMPSNDINTTTMTGPITRADPISMVLQFGSTRRMITCHCSAMSAASDAVYPVTLPYGKRLLSRRQSIARTPRRK
jgi:hypothetical protein